MTETSIYVTFDLEGFHAWKDAPDEVAFLRNHHRHLFKFYVEIEVTHDDRDLEFFMVQRELKKEFEGKIDNKSCEMIAGDVVTYCSRKYPDRFICVKVSEDGENGACVRYSPIGEEFNI